MAEAAGMFVFRKRRASPAEEERRALLEGLCRTRALIAQAYAGFNSAEDPDLIESYVFEINALQSRYCYLLRRVKELDMPSGDGVDPARTGQSRQGSGG